MRFQSTFEKISQGANHKIFAACFVALRIGLGLASLYLVVNLSGAVAVGEGNRIENAVSAVMFEQWMKLFTPVMVCLGISFTTGLFVRPVAFSVAAILILLAVISGTNNPEALLFSQGLLALVFCLFAAGGSSHVLGFDGIISRNIRRPNVLTRFLFG